LIITITIGLTCAFAVVGITQPEPKSAAQIPRDNSPPSLKGAWVIQSADTHRLARRFSK
jgi:hypothetical protein